MQWVYKLPIYTSNEATNEATNAMPACSASYVHVNPVRQACMRARSSALTQLHNSPHTSSTGGSDEGQAP